MDKRMPVLEMKMNKYGFHLRLADENTSLSVTLPKEMVDGIVARWQAFQSGTETQTAYSRHDTGEWPELGE